MNFLYSLSYISFYLLTTYSAYFPSTFKSHGYNTEDAIKKKNNIDCYLNKVLLSYNIFLPTDFVFGIYLVVDIFNKEDETFLDEFLTATMKEGGDFYTFKNTVSGIFKGINDLCDIQCVDFNGVVDSNYQNNIYSCLINNQRISYFLHNFMKMKYDLGDKYDSVKEEILKKSTYFTEVLLNEDYHRKNETFLDVFISNIVLLSDLK